jgi:hypothetical protein
MSLNEDGFLEGFKKMTKVKGFNAVVLEKGRS